MVFGGGCATSARTQDPLAGTYFGSGSGAGLEQVQALAKRFGVLHPGVEFKLDDAGSETGIVLVIQNQIDFGTSVAIWRRTKWARSRSRH